ncbi:GntR family transcriptional regulator [Streptomyces sp. NPDC012421]|uniref:GntR family transcriptional regulator n=1 Tax=Streptomyces sp. NPDC012421 TaxID=3364832 RepID=UPI0036E76FB0
MRSSRIPNRKGEDVAGASPRGTYALIADVMRREIVEGRFAEGFLPSEAKLMQQHNVSRNTVRRALKLLQEAQLITPHPGAGWRVGSAGSTQPLTVRLTELIRTDALSVGDPYPSESQLCERFGASRTAVRRALAQLEGSGVLDAVHGKGRTVRALPAASEQP